MVISPTVLLCCRLFTRSSCFTPEFFPRRFALRDSVYRQRLTAMNKLLQVVRVCVRVCVCACVCVCERGALTIVATLTLYPQTGP